MNGSACGVRGAELVAGRLWCTQHNRQFKFVENPVLYADSAHEENVLQSLSELVLAFRGTASSRHLAPLEAQSGSQVLDIVRSGGRSGRQPIQSAGSSQAPSSVRSW